MQKLGFQLIYKCFSASGGNQPGALPYNITPAADCVYILGQLHHYFCLSALQYLSTWY